MKYTYIVASTCGCLKVWNAFCLFVRWQRRCLCCSGKLAAFTVLCEQYQPSIKRDPSYREYLDKIAQIFFGVPPPRRQNSGGLFGKTTNPSCISTRVDLVFYWEKKVFLEFLNIASSWLKLFLAIQLVFMFWQPYLKNALNISITLAVVDEHVYAHSLCSFFLVTHSAKFSNWNSYLIL